MQHPKTKAAVIARKIQVGVVKFNPIYFPLPPPSRPEFYVVPLLLKLKPEN
jgi:hypothetical protein